MKLQNPCIHNYLALNHDNNTKCHLNKRIDKSTFSYEKTSKSSHNIGDAITEKICQELAFT